MAFLSIYNLCMCVCMVLCAIMTLQSVDKDSVDEGFIALYDL